MTDNEIIKELNLRIDDFSRETLDLINRQKAIIEKSEKVEHFADKTIETANAEIERLNIEFQSMRSAANYYKMHYVTAKSEAIKEFAERFAKALSEFDMSSVGLPDYDRGYKDCMMAIEDTIDSLVKEMKEVNQNDDTKNSIPDFDGNRSIR